MPLSWNEIKSRALTFSRTWADASNEDAEAKPFWLAFFEIFGITDKRVATFELNVKKLGQAQGFVDLFWPGMLLVEHKSRGKNLDRAFQQALDYVPGLPERDLPQLIIVCDFARFRLYRLATGESIEFALADLHQHIQWFGFIAGYRVQQIRAQDPVNVKAAERMGQLHDALHASGYTGHHLELLLVRVLFCLFADDTGIFQPAQSFRAFIEERTSADGSDLGLRLGHLFQALNTPPARRSAALDMQVAAFPYINGKLFEEILPFADFDSKMREVLLNACALDWSAISPAIFGSLFQSIMDSTARRNLGAHYTSEENILKLIGPLFLDDLRAEFNRVKGQRQRLQEFHQKLRQITFFDPACGCGNFLVISYRELRLLELEVLRASHALLGKAGQQSVDVHNLIGVDVDQCYGIEIEEFPAQIAQVALWLIDHQMNLRVSEEFGLYFARIPLNTSPHIVHGNALQLDWQEILPVQRCSFVLGNPPFLGKTYQSQEQKMDMLKVMQGIHGAGDLDFVAAWYVKAAQYLCAQDSMASFPATLSRTRCAFVSTNSIVQGEQVGVLWGWMLAQGVKTHFAHRTFSWSNEAKGNAAVHCVIIGFGLHDVSEKFIFEYDDVKGPPHAVPVQQVNSYLIDAPSIALTKRRTPICPVPELVNGSKPADGGHLILNDAEKQALLQQEPNAHLWIRPFVGANEFINKIPRWCLWLVDCPPNTVRTMPEILKRVNAVKAMRKSSSDEQTRFDVKIAPLFQKIRQPKDNYLLIPSVSSERREYIPIGFMTPDVIASNLVYTLSGATLFHFGILSSTMHNAWMRTTCGRLESRYRYSNSIVYNNFPWPDLPHASAKAPVQKVQAAIEQAAQAVLDARAQFSEASLADLYDPLAMPPALVKAHQRLDAAVDKAYALCGGPKSYASDAQRVAFLFQRYQQLTSLLPATPASKPRRARLA